MSELMERGVLAGTGYDKADQYETLDALELELRRTEALKRDYIVDTRRMTFQTDADGSALVWDTPTGETDEGKVRPHAHGQIAQRLGIPKTYYDRLGKEFPALLDQNVNGWFAHKPERRMVRLLDGHVRAFLSDRYRRMDNYDLMTQAIVPVLREVPGLHFQVAHLTPEKLHINALLPGLTAEVRVGDVVQAGVAIRNSEVGSGSLFVAPRVWRLSCLNGLLVDAFAMRKFHVGRQADEEAYDLFADDTLKADDTAYYLKCRDMVKAALTEATFTTIVGKLTEAANTDAIQNPVAATEMLANRFTLREAEEAAVLRQLTTGGDLTRWGVINAMTAAAKDAETYERQRDMEAAGGVLMESTDREWAALVAA